MQLFGRFRSRTLPSILDFTPAPWNIPMFDHMLNLPFHRDEEQNYKVKQKNGPEDGDIEYFEKRQKEGRDRSSCARIPKFELRKSSRERPNDKIEIKGVRNKIIILNLLY